MRCPRFTPRRRCPLQKSLYTPYKGAFNAKALGKWVDGLTTNTAGAAPFAEGTVGASKIAVVTPWDGKDAVAQGTVDEISLDDLDL